MSSGGLGIALGQEIQVLREYCSKQSELDLQFKILIKVNFSFKRRVWSQSYFGEQRGKMLKPLSSSFHLELLGVQNKVYFLSNCGRLEASEGGRTSQESRVASHADGEGMTFSSHNSKWEQINGAVLSERGFLKIFTHYSKSQPVGTVIRPCVQGDHQVRSCPHLFSLLALYRWFLLLKILGHLPIYAQHLQLAFFSPMILYSSMRKT